MTHQGRGEEGWGALWAVTSLAVSRILFAPSFAFWVMFLRFTAHELQVSSSTSCLFLFLSVHLAKQCLRAAVLPHCHSDTAELIFPGQCQREML